MMFWHGGRWAGGTIAFWVLVIWASYALVAGITRRPDPPAPDGSSPSPWPACTPRQAEPGARSPASALPPIPT